MTTVYIPAVGNAGVASFAIDDTYASRELFSGDTKVTTTKESVAASTTLATGSVVGRTANVPGGALTLATYGGENTFATGVLTFSGTGTEDDTVTIGAVVYRLRDTLAAAYDVKIGGTAAATAANLIAAVNASGTAGTEYYTGTLEHPYVRASQGVTTATVDLVSLVPGQAGELATTESGTGTSFVNTTLVGGVGSAVKPVGILTGPVTTGEGVTTTVHVYRSGMFNPDVLVWHSSFNTAAKKAAAFEGSISPNIFIQSIDYQD